MTRPPVLQAVSAGSALAPSPLVAAIDAYAPAPHGAPCDLDLAGSSTAGADDVAFAAALADARARTARYPDAREVAGRIAGRFGVGPDRVLVTAGADEALERACRAVLSPGRNAIVTDPTFEMIPRYVTLAGGELRQVAWPGEPFPGDALLALADERTALVAVVSPNNPTGAVATLAEIRRLHDALPSALILLDFAYAEFADTDLTVAVLKLPRVVVARTLSKAWRMPGIRVGYAIGAPEVIGWMRAAGGPYSVSSLSLAVAETALAGDAAVRETAVAAVKANRTRLEALLADLREDVSPSQANFVCVVDGRVRWLRDALAGFGIATRLLVARSKSGPLERLRITVPADEPSFGRLERAIRTALAPEAILFDLDGVIADVSQSYREAVRLTAARYGVTITLDAIRARKALGNANNDWIVTTELIRAGGGTASLTEVTDAFERIYQGVDGTPGLREAERLIVPREWIVALGKRYPLAIVTGRPRADAERFLDRFGLRKLFRTIVTLEAGPLKPDPFPVAEALRALRVERAWMVGDTPDDIVSARAAGALPIGVIPPGDDQPEALESVLYRAGAARVFDNSTRIASCLP